MKNKKIIISALLCVMLLALFTSTVLLNQQPTTANAATDDISDLTGYSWVGNTTSPTWQDGCNINLGAKINFSINGEGSYGDLGFFGVGYDFDDNGPEYVPIYGILSLGVSRSSPGTYYSNGMIITFTGGDDVTNPTLINWLQTYGTLMAPEPEITDLTGYKWVGNTSSPTWQEGATAGFGVFDVNFIWSFRSFMQFHIGFDAPVHTADGTILLLGYEPQLDEITEFAYGASDEIAFIGGDDVTNPELIEFLQAYGTLTKADDSEIQTVKASRYVANRDDLNLLGAGSMSHMAFEFKSNKTNYTGISIEDTGTEAYFYYDDTIVYKQSTGWVDERYKTIELANDQILLTPIYKMFVAVYEENPIIRYKVVLNANFDGAAANVEKNLTDDQTLSLTLPTNWVRDGYTFQGWATNPSGTVKYNDAATVSNLYTQYGETVDLYAVWKINTYNITFILNGEELINVKAEYNTAMQDIINNNVDILKYRAVGDIPELVKQDYAIKLESTEVGQAINNVKNNKTVQNATTIALIAIIASVALIIIKKALK